MAWKREGYPFDSLVPSYATAIGVSGDTPAALADLMGIILNGGIRNPNVMIRDLRFGQNTPVEAVLRRDPTAGQRVLSPEIAALVHQELIEVVQKGTARRAQGGIRLGDGTVIPVGGKTGTGDNQFKVFGGAGTQSARMRSIARLHLRFSSGIVSMGLCWRSFPANQRKITNLPAP